MILMSVVLVFMFSLGNIYSAEPIRLDKMKDVKFRCTGFEETKRGWHMKDNKVVQEETEFSITITFPKIIYITKIILNTRRHTINSVNEDAGISSKKLEITGLYNFDILCFDSVWKQMKTIYEGRKNDYTEKEIKGKFKTNEIKIVMLSYDEGEYRYCGGVNKVQIFGYQNEEDFNKKDSPKEIRTKEEASKALKNGEITPKQFIDYLNKFKK
jgi:hypothetical protein